MVGRHINLRTEIKPVATEQLLSTFLMQGQCRPPCPPSSFCPPGCSAKARLRQRVGASLLQKGKFSPECENLPFSSPLQGLELRMLCWDLIHFIQTSALLERRGRF